MRRLHPRALPALAVCAMVALTGCRSFRGAAPQTMLDCNYRGLLRHSDRSGPGLVAQVYDAVSKVPLDAVLVQDERLFDRVVVHSLYAARTPSDTVQVTARFANCSDRELQVRARTAFLRADRGPAEPVSAWQTLFLPPRSLSVYQESSLTRAEVANYVIEIAPND